MGCNSARLPLLLERVGMRRINWLSPLIPATSSVLRTGFSLKRRRSAHLCRYLCRQRIGERG
jgi:hypothetical protein